MNLRPLSYLAILGAVPTEVKGFLALLRNIHPLNVVGETFWVGYYEDQRILLGTVGLGKVNAAITTATLLQRYPVGQVWHVGCSGAYAEASLYPGDVLISREILCGDEGILTENEVLSGSEIGIPILVHQNEPFYDRIPFSDSIIRWIHDKTPPGYYHMDEQNLSSPAYPCHLNQNKEGNCSDSFQMIFGPSLTVSMVSGDAEIARKRFEHYGALAENMEGSGVAQTCFRFGVSVVECRGISNIAGERRKDYWEIEKAVVHCHGIVINWLQELEAIQD